MVTTIVNNFTAFKTAELMQAAARDYIAARLDAAIARAGTAKLLLSGGSSPRPIYEGLSRADIAWEQVKLGLVDERWAAADGAGSNADFIRRTLLTNKAQRANFVPMRTGHPSAKLAASAVSTIYAQALIPADICIMGMGLDGHTASWFAGAEGLGAAVDIDNPMVCSAVDARGCEVAGVWPERMSLTLPAIMSAAEIILLINGSEKRKVFEAAQDKSVFDAPVKALLNAGPRLKIFWGA